VTVAGVSVTVTKNEIFQLGKIFFLFIIWTTGGYGILLGGSINFAKLRRYFITFYILGLRGLFLYCSLCAAN